MLIICFTFIIFSSTKADVIKNIEVYGNERITDKTIILFSEAKLNFEIDENDLNLYLKNLYETNFFKDIRLDFKNNVLSIYVKEEPIIQSVVFKGIKASKFIEPLRKKIKLKDRSSYKESLFLEDKKKIQETLRLMGYYFSEISSSIEDLGDNKINLIYDISVGEKARIAKISFTGNKIYKDKKLRSIIASEEYKFWKFISGRKFLNEELITIDKKLLNNFYLNNGYYDVKVNTSFAKLISNNEFELIFNIDADKKFFLINLI